MDIIPYREANIQVGIAAQKPYSDTSQSHLSVKGVGLSPIQREALRLYDAGLNVFPQPVGRKAGYTWKQLQHTRLDRDDSRYGLRKLFAGTCNLAVMCGRTSGNLFVIDCESTDAFTYHLRQLQQRKIPIWAVRTARGGHFYLRARDGEVTNIAPGKLRDTEIKGQHGYVLGPPSVHPTGAVYEWIIRDGAQPPLVHCAQIDWLHDLNRKKLQLEFTVLNTSYRPGFWKYPTQKATTNLSRSTQNYLSSGHLIQSGTRNNRLFSAACDLNGNGHTYEAARTLLKPVAAHSGLSNAEIEKTIGSAYSKARTPARPISQTRQATLQEDWYHAFLFGVQRKWTGRTMSSQRACFLALVERCRVAANEKGVFRASIRELALLARLGTATVQKRLKELIDTKLLVKCGHDQQSNASLWHFGETLLNEGKTIALKSDTLAPPPHWLSYSVSVFNSDSVERGGLGHGVMFVYQYLRMCTQSLTPSALAGKLCITLNQANYALRKLRHFRLVERDYTGWKAYNLATEELAEHVHEYAEVIGKGAARKARFARERAIFAARRLFFERESIEGKQFRQALARMLPSRIMRRYEREIMAIVDDPILMCGLELGGVIRLQDGCDLALE